MVLKNPGNLISLIPGLSTPCYAPQITYQVLCNLKHTVSSFQPNTAFCDFCSQQFRQFSTFASIKVSFLIVLLIKGKLIPYHRINKVAHVIVLL